MENAPKQKHFVLVHGAGHGAWCWFKLKPLLESVGHRVTALDLSGSGTNTRKMEEITTIYDYSLPLIEFLEAIPASEKVILVGHSLGGLNVALAMEMYPYKVTVAVFLTAFMPDTTHSQSYVIDKLNERTPPESWLDTQFLPYSGGTTILFGPKILSSKFYQNSSTQSLVHRLVSPRMGGRGSTSDSGRSDDDLSSPGIDSSSVPVSEQSGRVNLDAIINEEGKMEISISPCGQFIHAWWW